MLYPINKYKFYFHKNHKYGGTEITAVSTYAGKTVKGKAICHIDDKFSEESGKQLASLRCGTKIAAKRLKRANECYTKAEKAMKEAINKFEKMKEYKNDAKIAYEDAKMAEEVMIEKMKNH